MLKGVHSDQKLKSYSRKMIDNEEDQSRQFPKGKKQQKKTRESSIAQASRHHQLPNIHKNHSRVESVRRIQQSIPHSKEKYIPSQLTNKFQIKEPGKRENSRNNLQLPSIQKSSSSILNYKKQVTNYLKVEKKEKHSKGKQKIEIKTQVSQIEGFKSQRTIALDRYASQHMQFLNRLEKVVVYTRMSSGATCVAMPKFR